MLRRKQHNYRTVTCLVFISRTAPVSRMCGSLQQLQVPFVWKHVLILHQQAISSQLREQLNQLTRKNTPHWMQN